MLQNKKIFKYHSTEKREQKHRVYFFFRKVQVSHTQSFQRHSFSGLIDSIGELLHIHNRFPTSMATALLSLSINTFCGILN